MEEESNKKVILQNFEDPVVRKQTRDPQYSKIVVSQ